MISENTLKVIRLTFTEVTSAHSVPFDYNKKTQQLQQSTKKSKFYFRINLLADFCWRFPTTLLTIHMISNANITNCIILILYLVGSILMGGSLTLSSIFFGSEFIDFSNKFLQTEDYFKRMFTPTISRKVDLLFLITFTGTVVKFFTSLAMIPLLVRPDAFENFYLYLGGHGWFGRIFVALVQTVIVYNNWNLVLIFSFPAISYVFSTVFWLEFLGDKLKHEQISFKDAVHYYYNLVLCNKMYRNAMSVIFFPVAKIVFPGLCILALFSVIMFSHILDPASLFLLVCFGVGCALVLIIFIGLANSLRTKSEDFLKVLSLHTSNEEEVLTFKSIPFLQAYVDPLFVYQKGTLLTIFRYVIDSVITLILDARVQD